jgi:glycosyltransferase involved in cell wall biosynthesis
MNPVARPRICFLAGTLGVGGAERQLFYYARALRERGADVRVLCFGRAEFWEEPLASAGIPVIPVSVRSRVARLVRMGLELRRYRPSFLQSQHFYTNPYVAVLGRALRIADIGTLRSDGHLDVLSSGRLAAWGSLHLPRLLAANSQAALQFARQRGVAPARLRFAPNVVDTARFRPGARKQSGSLQILTAARMVPVKRLDRFLRILHRLRAESQLEVTGTVVGHGPMQGEWQSLAAKLGLGPDIVDFRGPAELEGAYGESDLFVLTSDHEGTPNVLLEAMASGLPVVASRVGGVPDVVEPGHAGFLVDPDDEEGYCAAIGRLGRDLELRRECGRQARAWVEAHCSLAVLPAVFEQLYADRLGRESEPMAGRLAERPSGSASAV